MARKIYGFGVSPPEENHRDYFNFVNSGDCTGKKENPSTLENMLPEDWRRSGWSRGYNNQLMHVGYEFPDHLNGLNREEVLEITKTLFKLGAESWEFKGTYKD